MLKVMTSILTTARIVQEEQQDSSRAPQFSPFSRPGIPPRTKLYSTGNPEPNKFWVDFSPVGKETSGTIALMLVVSVNVGMPQEVVWKRQRVSTAIFKAPVKGTITVRKLNLDGDRQADLTVHGGPDKAVYAYPVEHYEYWRMQVPEMPATLGAFGENLTTRDVLEKDLHIGDQVRVGSALLQVSQPRMPCYKLQVRFDREDMTKLFALSRRSGFYLSVIEEGKVKAGDAIEVVERDKHRVSIADVNGLYFDRPIDRELAKRALQEPALTAESRSMVLSRLAQVDSS